MSNKDIIDDRVYVLESSWISPCPNWPEGCRGLICLLVAVLPVEAGIVVLRFPLSPQLLWLGVLQWDSVMTHSVNVDTRLSLPILLNVGWRSSQEPLWVLLGHQPVRLQTGVWNVFILTALFDLWLTIERFCLGFLLFLLSRKGLFIYLILVLSLSVFLLSSTGTLA